jgi:uncharacterized membrane protein
MSTRRDYLDWLRGIAVLIMIEGHTIDAWTRAADRDRASFGYAIILGGFGGPIFLFLAGAAVSLAAGSRVGKGMSRHDAAAVGRARGWRIFGLAFLFRAQSILLSGGDWMDLFKVDILNIMGLAMVAAAALWGASRSDRWRIALLAAGAVVLTMTTPIVRAAPVLSSIPDPVEWYIRPNPGRSTFTLFPWAGFLLAGAALGVWLDSARTDAAERRIMLALAIGGPAAAFLSYGAALLPPLYTQASFWTSSPTFFFLRVGVLLALVPTAYAVSRRFRSVSAPLEYFGRASLFVYWIHVEMVYGVVSIWIHRRLSLERWVLAFVVFTVALFWLAKLKDRLRPGTR